MTFGKILHDAQRLIKNHSYTLEMINRGKNHSQNLSMIAWKSKIILFGDPQGYILTVAIIEQFHIFFHIFFSFINAA